MRDSGNISQYRSRLDQTLSCHDLVDDDMLKTLVKNQILRSSGSDFHECSENLVDRRTKEVANFLSMLRSASVTDSEASNGGWKVKQDTEEIRVMYREGPEGTPYHTLLAEGYVDGPIDVCLCISWEAELFKKWWPQTTIPTFKIAESVCLQKIRTGEQICLVRMKLSRPLSAREAVVHLFAFEYFQDGLIVVVANSISDVDNIGTSTHGHSKDRIPNAQDVVRVDLVGGFALQKVTNNRSYFRTIGNLDIKLDFIPPALINFVSRQLVGGGFKLYKKEVASVAKGDEDFSKALKDPMYAQIREALYSDKIPNGDIALELQDLKTNVVPVDEETRTYNDEKCPDQKVQRDNCITNLPEQENFEVRDKNIHGEIEEIEVEASEKVHRDNCITNLPEQENFEVRDKNIHGEIEEIEVEASEKVEHLYEDDRKVCDSPVNQLVQKSTENKNFGISPEVKQALGTLDEAISIIREYRCKLETRTVPNTNVMLVDAKTDSLQDSKSSEADKDRRNSSCSRRTSSSLCIREAHNNKIAPASPDVYATIPGQALHIALCSSTDQAMTGKIMENISKDDNMTAAHANGIHEKELGETKTRKLPRYCCLYFLSGRVA